MRWTRATRPSWAQGLLLGLVVEPGKPDYVQGDFLVRDLLGADPRHRRDRRRAPGPAGTGRAAARARRRVGDPRPARGARPCAARRWAGPPVGALVFTCNGRGRGMFGVPDHDASLIADALGGAPAPASSRPARSGPWARDFLHGFTATVALFGYERACSSRARAS